MALTSKHDRICLAFLRRILAFCKDRVQFSLDGMVRELGIPENFHSELFARIDQFGILRPVSPKQQSMTVKRTVKKRALAPFLKQYFRDGELSETAKNTDSCVDNSLRDIPGGAAPKRKPTNESDVPQMSSVNANKEPLAKRRRKVSDGY
ncbi:uncharacterized protein LOC113367130 [Ctenocephalides felis]|uniref:uncharacterized protein LOC113367130 n=1 Tax=Ctenocephalides felis TaxID=7515 RepID=UPI000E6E4C40|nr:uncharacterized protein LOC113367130 [Ctenocephalides felis]